MSLSARHTAGIANRCANDSTVVLHIPLSLNIVQGVLARDLVSQLTFCICLFMDRCIHSLSEYSNLPFFLFQIYANTFL